MSTTNGKSVATAEPKRPLNKKQRKQLRFQQRMASRKAKREARARFGSDSSASRERCIFDKLVQAAIANRMCQRFYDSKPPSDICYDFRYWQARKCGWDAVKPDCIGLWPWWIELHYKTRQFIVDMSGYRLVRGRETTKKKDMQIYLSRP